MSGHASRKAARGFLSSSIRRQQDAGVYGAGKTEPSKIVHPHRALPPGQQWVGHCGKKAAARYLKQQARLELKRLRKEHGITSPIVSGIGPGGALLIDVPADQGPTRAKPVEEK